MFLLTALQNDILAPNYKDNAVKVEIEVLIIVINGPSSAENAGTSTHIDTNESG